jgi:hypothetical protein
MPAIILDDIVGVLLDGEWFRIVPASVDLDTNDDPWITFLAFGEDDEIYKMTAPLSKVTAFELDTPVEPGFRDEGR